MGRQEFPGGGLSCRDACPVLWPASRHHTPGIIPGGLAAAGQRLEESRVSAPAGGKAKSAAAGLPRGQEPVPGHQVCTGQPVWGMGWGRRNSADASPEQQCEQTEACDTSYRLDGALDLGAGDPSYPREYLLLFEMAT